MAVMTVVLAVLAVSSLAACNKKDSAATTTTSVAGPKAGMQLRAVTGPAGDCGPIPDVPPPDQPLNVLFQTQCLGLAPAGLVVTTADVEPATDSQSDAPLVRINLKGADVEKMAAFSKDNLNKRVAVIAFGKVLALAQFQAAVTNGKFQITGVGRNDALRLRAALA